MTDHKYSDDVLRVLFDWASLSEESFEEIVERTPRKILRWLGAHHPDNRTRIKFFKATGVSIGEGTNITPGLIVNDGYSGLCSIGQRVSIATNVCIVIDSNPNNSKLASHPYVKDHLLVTAPVTIEDDVWLGTNAVILPGVTVGRGAVVGAGAVVNQDVPAYSVVAGVPARVIRTLDPKEG